MNNKYKKKTCNGFDINLLLTKHVGFENLDYYVFTIIALKG
jgi:hypothetical protein